MTHHLEIDKLDRKILDIISKNAKTPYLEVARECNVSGAAIHQRVQRLIKIGVITGSQFNVDPDRVGFKTCAFIGIFLNHPDIHKKVIEEFKGIPEITECHYTTGNYSLFIKVYARNNKHLMKVLTERIQHIEGVVSTETFLSLEESINRELSLLEE